MAFQSAGGVPRALITILKPRGMETSPFRSGIPEERKSLPSEAARLPGCCCHLLPTRSLAAHGSPDLGTRQGKGGEENAGILEFRSGLVVPRRSVSGQCGLPLSSLGTAAVDADEGMASPAEEPHAGEERDKHTRLMQLLSGLLLDTA